MTRVRLSVDIEREIKHRIAVLAALRGLTISEVVVEALRKELSDTGMQELIQRPSRLAGALRQYADAEKRSQEESAWAAHAANDLH
jgi:hypothetical protein